MKYSNIYQSPIGKLQIIANDYAITYLNFEKSIIPHSINSNSIIEQAILELENYFSKTLTSFTVTLQPNGTDFQIKTWQLLQQISFGKTISYKELAKLYGDPLAIRALASANGKNPIPIIIPCHRVIGSNGGLVGFSGGLDIKAFLLRHEGVFNQIDLF
jgi:methylated-DNA-[protein]-cysteine S-methyltransferase